jgi:membrane-associated phospholipid phosphatase
MFAGNPVPFAAFPSGHVAWATVVMVTIPSERRWYFASYVSLVAWATMYANHHYLFDVIGAITVVAIGRLLMTRLLTSDRPPNASSASEKPLLGNEQDFCMAV